MKSNPGPFSKTFEYGKSVFKKLEKMLKPKASRGKIKDFFVVGGLIVLTLAAVAIFLSVICFFALLPSIVVGGFLWFVWTYLGFGAGYFPTLSPLYLSIPFTHFVLITAVLHFLSKLLRISVKKD